MALDIVVKDKWYCNTIFTLKVLMGDIISKRGGPIIFKERFDLFCVSIIDLHLVYFIRLNEIIESNDSWLTHELLKRWKIVNQLIIEHIKYSFKEIDSNFPNSSSIQGLPILLNNLLIIASLVAYPLLEETARKISNVWDEEGKMLIKIYNDTDSTKPPNAIVTQGKSYNNGEPIISLFHKLQIMKQSLPKELQSHIEDLDARLRKSPIQGDQSDVFPPLFRGLKNNRDKLLHGREFDGYEAVYISLILAMIYFKPSEQELTQLITFHQQKPAESYKPQHYPLNLFSDKKIIPEIFL